MDMVRLKVDSKGRIRLPSEIREEMGDIVVATRTPKGILIRPSMRNDFIEEFKRVITTEPGRTGEPETGLQRR